MNILTILILLWSMSTGYLSIYLCLLPFLSSVFYGFLCRDLLPPSLNLLLSILFFDTIITGISIIISFSDSLLLVYRNATVFCILILNPATLLNSLISSNSFLVESLGFSLYKIMSSANRDNLTFSFLIWIPFISFSYLTALVRTSSITLNRTSESENSCLVPDLRGKAFRC